MQTIQQERAKYALKKVQEASQRLKSKEHSEYKSYASGLPAMIHMNGLGQASAFYRSRNGVHLELYQVLSDWLTQSNQPLRNYNDLLEGITESDMATYQLAQAEAQALMDWVKKFAKAFMGDD